MWITAAMSRPRSLLRTKSAGRMLSVAEGPLDLRTRQSVKGLHRAIVIRLCHGANPEAIQPAQVILATALDDPP